MVELDLPMPPSANHIWSRTKTGMRHSDRYRAWMDEAGWIAKAQYPQPFLGPYKLTVRIARPDKRKRDLDNFAFKALNDLLVRLGIVEDDCFCEMITARWVSAGDGVHVRVEPAGREA